MIETLSLVLQPGLLDEARRAELWRRAARKPAFYVGFLKAIPDDLPQGAARDDAQRVEARLSPLAEGGNPWARYAIKISSARGQAFVDTVQRALRKPANQEVVTATLDALARYFAPLRSEGDLDFTTESLIEEAEQFVSSGQEA
ncbi:MAG TPA: sulfur reduction protein DsrS, partial [Chromatiales bacterium]|nr:sulfur reduction protein DsrS [Chromatiales bacterium]